MGCEFCEGVPDRYNRRPPERLPYAIISLDECCFVRPEISMYIIDGYLDFRIMSGVTGKSIHRVKAVNFCPECGRNIKPADPEPREEDDEDDEF